MQEAGIGLSRQDTMNATGEEQIATLVAKAMPIEPRSNLFDTPENRVRHRLLEIV